MRDKILIITGSTGIGAAAARLAVSQGARLVVAASDELSGWELAAETGAECWVGDLTHAGSAASVVSQCLSRFGRVDAVFNVAGLGGRRFGDGPAHEVTAEGWDVILTQNLTVTFQVCQAAISRMLEQAVAENGVRGAIVNMGSVLAEAPEPRHFASHAYAAAKGAIAAGCQWPVKSPVRGLKADAGTASEIFRTSDGPGLGTWMPLPPAPA